MECNYVGSVARFSISKVKVETSFKKNLKVHTVYYLSSVWYEAAPV